jgi:FAD/FMN-containing dehydrogenase
MVGKDSLSPALKKEIDHCIYDGLQAIGGSVSAEHGIGTHKKAYLDLCRTSEEIMLMKTLKKTLDPKGLLNPGKIF